MSSKNNKAGKNQKLNKAKVVKNDEFYTQLHDIETEINAYLEYDPDVFRGKTILLPCDDPTRGEGSNFTQFFAQKFEEFGLKKLISTSYAPESKKMKVEPDLFEQNSPQYDAEKTKIKGKIFILEKDITNDGRIDNNDLEWKYLEGDGDFQSDEIKKLRDEADFIITNPPFSLFHEFLKWILEANKKFIIIGNMNTITTVDVFPLIKKNTIWLGATGIKAKEFRIPASKAQEILKDNPKTKKIKSDDSGGYVVKMGNTCWYTNVEHGRRHEPLTLMTMSNNLKYSKYKELRGRKSYDHYDNYDAIHVPYVNAIPSDYKGVMGVPISFMGKYCPEQFKIIGMNGDTDTDYLHKPNKKKYDRPYLHSARLYGKLFIQSCDDK